MATTVKTEWGHQLSADPPDRGDHKVSGAQARILHLIKRSTVEAAGEGKDVRISDYHWFWPFRWILNRFVRERIIQRGFTDAAYYMAPDGEAYVREAVYGEILRELDDHTGDTEVRLHLIADSLGVTVAHDFLFALFNDTDGYEPGYTKQTDPPPTEVAALNTWRAKAESGELRVGSFVAAGSQLPVFLLRKQAIVNRFYENKDSDDERVNPRLLGLSEDTVQWLLFYDVDDLLAYPTRHLYAPRKAIREVQVESADRPDKAHTKYWRKKKVLEEAASLILSRIG